MIGTTAKPFPFLFPYFLPFPYFLVDYHFHIARPVKSQKRRPGITVTIFTSKPNDGGLSIHSSTSISKKKEKGLKLHAE